MTRILVIADDFTGAAEIGGVGVQHGLSARVVRGHATAEDAHVELLVVDTDTRRLAPADAAARVREVIGACDPGFFDVVYKKTDSVLRGPVAAELDAIRSALRHQRVLLAPQNPTLGRVIRDGRYFVADVPLDRTHFARDPDHPRTSADVRELLGEPRQNIAVVEGDSVQDLAAAARRIGRGCLPAGGADFFRAVLEARGLERTETARAPTLVPPVGGDQLIVCGSASESSRCAVTDAVARGAAVVPMPRQLYESDAHQPLTSMWSDPLVDRLVRRGAAVMAIAQPAVAARARHVRRVVADTVARVLSRHRPDVLWLEGGATAAAIVEMMNWRRFDVQGTLAAGVVALRTADQPPQRLVLKPGSYAWPPGVL